MFEVTRKEVLLDLFPSKQEAKMVRAWSLATLLVAAWVVTGCNTAAAPDNGCSNAASFVDKSGAGTSRVVSFGGQNGSGVYSYLPQCMLIAAGQTVTFQGDFSAHPLRPGLAPGGSGTASSNSPITNQDSGTTADITFPTAGTYPYYCQNHHGMGMYGSIKAQ
jgi:plastocyanin